MTFKKKVYKRKLLGKLTTYTLELKKSGSYFILLWTWQRAGECFYKRSVFWIESNAQAKFEWSSIYLGPRHLKRRRA